MNKTMKTLSLMFAVGAMLFSSGLHHEDAKVAKAAESTKIYKKVTETLTDWSGEYLIVYEAGNVAFDGSLTELDATKNTKSISIANDTITLDECNYYFTIENNQSNQYIKSASGYYIGRTANSNGLDSNQTKKYENTMLFSSGNIEIKSSNGTYLRYNNASNQNRFRYYTKGQQAISLYKLNESSISKTLESLSYSGSLIKTDYTTDDTFSSEGLTITAKYSDNSTEDVTSKVTWEKLTAGMTSIKGTYDGKEITISGITVTAAVIKYTASIILDVENIYVDEIGTLSYEIKDQNGNSFDEEKITKVTWNTSDEDILVIDNNGEYLAGSTEGEVTISLHIETSDSSNNVFDTSLKVSVSNIGIVGNGKWYSVTDVSDLHPNDKIIIAAKNENYALGSQKSNNRSAVPWDKESKPDYSNVHVLVLEQGTIDNTFAFNTGAGYLYAASSSSNHLKEEKTISDNSSWLINITNETVSIVAQGTNTRNLLKYNSQSTLFSCYASGQQDISIYKYVSKNYDFLLTRLSELDTCTQYAQAANLRDLYNSLSDAEKVAFNEETIVDNEKDTGNEVTIKAINKLAYMELLKA